VSIHFVHTAAYLVRFVVFCIFTQPAFCICRHSVRNGCLSAITLLIVIAGIFLILFGLHRTIIFQSEPYRPNVYYAGIALCSTFFLWLAYCFCPGKKELARRKVYIIFMILCRRHAVK
jgi:hypothetical protein